MSTKTKTVFLCTDCGDDFAKWAGQCQSCKAWGTLQEMSISENKRSTSKTSTPPKPAIAFHELLETAEVGRISSGIAALDTVLGGGFMHASIVLFGGEPGIGKSTLSLQVAGYIDKCLYVSAEESEAQVANRAKRLGISSNGLTLSSENRWEAIEKIIQISKPTLLIVDSIQTISSKTLPSSPGSIIQVKESTRLIMEWAKVNNVCVFLAGHVTKEGELAGPRVLEHMVDVVMYLEGDRQSDLRVLRGTKNRFGSTNEVALLRMEDQGLIEVSDPSQHLLAERQNGAHGSAIVPVLEGSRPLLVEIQALSIPSNLPAPRKVANGVDQSRLIMLTAVLSKHSGIRLPFNQDIFVNAAGGLRIAETAADLAMLLAIASSIKEKPLIPDLIVVGEVGLGGELRSVPQLQIRLNEAKRLGFKKCLLPKSSKDSVGNIKGIEKLMASNLSQAINLGIYGKSK